VSFYHASTEIGLSPVDHWSLPDVVNLNSLSIASTRSGLSMSRGFLPPLLAALMGVGIGKCKWSNNVLCLTCAGVYTFQPVWEEHLQKQREQRIKQEADIGPDMVEVPVQKMSKQEEMNTGNDTGSQIKG